MKRRIITIMLSLAATCPVLFANPETTTKALPEADPEAVLGPAPDATTGATPEAIPEAAPDANARDLSAMDIAFGHLEYERVGDRLRIGFELDLSRLDVKCNRAVLLTPHLVGATDSLALSPIGVYGRNRYYFYTRNGKGMLAKIRYNAWAEVSADPDARLTVGAMNPGSYDLMPAKGIRNERVYRANDRPDTLYCADLIEFPAWAENSEVSLHLLLSEFGCCNSLIHETDTPCGTLSFVPAPEPGPMPEPEPVRVLTERSVSGSAYIDYPLDKIEIYPDFRGNAVELGRIAATLDSVRTDTLITVTRLALKGFASPEGPYRHNEELARERATSLREYVGTMYSLPDSLVESTYEPEDWEGLRRIVEITPLPHRDAILSLIDDPSLAPDRKEARIRSRYPDDYKVIADTIYPILRRTEYEIFYTVREYTNE